MKTQHDWNLVSMTGLGRASSSLFDTSVEIIIKSLNHRGLETRYRLPNEFFWAEPCFEQLIVKMVQRGRLDVLLKVSNAHPGFSSITVNKALAERVIADVEELYERHPHLLPLSMGDILALPGMTALESRAGSEQEWAPEIATVFKQALTDLQSEKEREGAALALALKTIFISCCKIVEAIDNSKDADIEKRFTKYKTRLDELFKDYDLNHERIYQEFALLTERSDFQEEIDRLKAHLAYFDSLCRSKESKGRKLDFLCQEMLRESNTLISKAFDGTITLKAIELKASIDRMREQVQNIE